MEGLVKFFDQRKAWGFLTFKDQDGTSKDCFFHLTDVVKPYLPSSGDHVSFDIKSAPKGLHATGVILDRRYSNDTR
jgi:cold shock CspA family protein